MSDSGDRYRFDFSADGLTVLRAYEQDDDGTYDRDDLDPGESYTLYGNAILHVEGSGSDAEWGIYVQEPGANTWIEAVDGHGTLDPTLIPSILSRLGVDDGEDDDDDEEEDEDEDDDGGIIGGDRYRIVFDDSGAVSQLWEIKDNGREEREWISPDETYSHIGDYVVKTEREDGGQEWEIYRLDAASGLFVEVADGRGTITLTEAALASLVAAEDGIAEDPENDDDDRFEGSEDDDDFLGGSDDDGDDVYMGGAGVDQVTFSGTAAVTVNLGLSQFQNSGRGYDRFVDIEEIRAANGRDRLVGDSDDNRFDCVAGDDSASGGSGDDTVNGGAGNDQIAGGVGDDSVVGGLGNDQGNGGDGADDLFGNEGADTLNGGQGNDDLRGGAGSDDLFGGAGGDTITGGAGADDLTGGGGADVFDFNTAGEIGRSTAHDIVMDFTRGVDHLDFSAFDFDFIRSDRFSADDMAELRFTRTDTGIRLIGDVNGDGVADFALEVNGVSRISEDDLML